MHGWHCSLYISYFLLKLPVFVLIFFSKEKKFSFPLTNFIDCFYQSESLVATEAPPSTTPEVLDPDE